MSTEKASCVRQNNMIIDKNIFASKLCTTANEHATKGFHEKNIGKGSKDMNDDI